MSKKACYRIRNWSKYNEALVNRGSIAFWFSDEICGLDSLTETLAQEYQSSINVNVLKFFYSMFKHESEEMSSSYIIKNLPKVIRNEKDSIISVGLPNYLEYNFHYK